MVEILKYLISSAVISGALVWLIREVVRLFFSRSLEKFKSELEKEVITHKLKYERMHSDRAEVIKQVYTRITRTHRSLGSFMSRLQLMGESTEEEKGKIAADAANSFTEYYEENRIFIDEDLAKKIDLLSQNFRLAWIKFQTKQHLPKNSDDALKQWQSAWDIINEQIPPIKQEIEKDFRKIIGISNK